MRPRRPSRIVIVLALVAPLLPLQVAPAIAQDAAAEVVADVLQHRGDAARTGEMPGPGPAETPTVRWELAVSTSDLLPDMVIADGVIHAATYSGALHAVDALTGEERWQVDLGGSPRFSPAAGAGLLSIQTDSGDDPGLRVLDALTGDAVWGLPLSFPSGPPILVDDMVLVIESPMSANGSILHALDAATGTERWRFESYVASGIAVADGSIYLIAGSPDEEYVQGVASLDAATGARRWFVPGLSAFDRWGLIVADGVVYALASVPGEPAVMLHALAASDGTEAWQVRVDVETVEEAAIVAGTIFFIDNVLPDTGPTSATLYAFDATTGGERWRSTRSGGSFGAPAVSGDTVYVGVEGDTAADSALVAYATEDGTERWSVPSDAWVSTVLVTGGAVYAASFAQLVAFGSPRK